MPFRILLSAFGILKPVWWRLLHRSLWQRLQSLRNSDRPSHFPVTYLLHLPIHSVSRLKRLRTENPRYWGSSPDRGSDSTFLRDHPVLWIFRGVNWRYSDWVWIWWHLCPDKVKWYLGSPCRYAWEWGNRNSAVCLNDSSTASLQSEFSTKCNLLLPLSISSTSFFLKVTQ
jgi:hypothetical protein